MQFHIKKKYYFFKTLRLFVLIFTIVNGFSIAFAQDQNSLTVTHEAVELFIANGQKSCFNSQTRFFEECPEVTYNIDLDTKFNPPRDRLTLNLNVVPVECTDNFSNSSKVLQWATMDNLQTHLELRFFIQNPINEGQLCANSSAKLLKMSAPYTFGDTQLEFTRRDGKKLKVQYSVELTDLDCQSSKQSEINDCRWQIKNLKIHN